MMIKDDDEDDDDDDDECHEYVDDVHYPSGEEQWSRPNTPDDNVKDDDHECHEHDGDEKTTIMTQIMYKTRNLGAPPVVSQSQ